MKRPSFPFDPSPEKTKERITLSIGDGIAIVGIIATISLTLGQIYSSHVTSVRAKEQSSVQIAVGILSQRAPRDKNGGLEGFPEDEQVLRRWAAQIVNKNAGETIPETARDALIKGAATLRLAVDEYTYPPPQKPLNESWRLGPHLPPNTDP